MFLALFFLVALFRALQGLPISSPHLPEPYYLHDGNFLSRAIGAENTMASLAFCIDASGRTEWGIIRSCLVTIFACTWTAIHPNIGAPTDSQWITFRRRVFVMWCALIAPEVMVLWAMKQREGAKRIVKKYNREIAKLKAPEGFFGFVKEWFKTPMIDVEGKNLPWSMVHGFFLQMGGFLLYENGQPVQVLDYKRLKKLIDTKKIDIPLLTKAEIKDRSKGDFIVKGLVLLQTSGFVIQSTARLWGRLPLIELEVVTLAFAMLNAITYILWWDKPQNVNVAMRIQLKNGQKGGEQLNVRQDSGEKDQDPADNEGSSTEGSDSDLDEDQPSNTRSNPSKSPYANARGPIMSSSSEETLIGDNSPREEGNQKLQQGNPIQSSQIPSSPPGSTTWLPAKKFWQQKIWEDYITTEPTGWKGWFLFLTIRMPYRLGQLLCYPFSKMGGGAVLDEKAHQHRVPMFYAESTLTDGVLALSTFIATVFGLIHFLAWTASFPSHTEKVLWRVTTVVITVEPVFFMLANLSGEPAIFKRWPWVDECITWVARAGMPLYIFARLALLVLAFFSLRDLPQAAYQAIEWTGIIPHL